MHRLATILLVLGILGCARPATAPAAPVPTVAASIPGMESGILRTELEERRFTCVGPTQTDVGVTWVCRGTKDAARYTATLRGTGATRISEVSATVFQDTPDDRVAEEFLSWVATIPYEGARPDNAKAWIQAELGKADTARKAFGAAMYTLTGPPDSRSLTITPTVVP